MNVRVLVVHMMSWWSSWLDRLLPRSCALCGLVLSPGAQVGLCSACLQDLEGSRRPRCTRCALPGSIATCACGSRFGGLIDRTIAAADYAPALDRLITTVKFARQPAFARTLGELIAAAWRGSEDRPVLDFLVPVPLSAERLADRGFNQALLMARACARLMPAPIPVMSDRLRRVRNNPAQSGLDRAARLHNLDDAFSCPALPAGSRIGLVDDVMTTGSTVLSAARVLRKAGAAQITVLVAARAGPASPATGSAVLAPKPPVTLGHAQRRAGSP